MATLSQILDLEVPVPGANTNTAVAVVLAVPDVSAMANNTVEEDAAETRKHVRTLIAQGTQAVTELLALARDLKTPRAYEVASNMLKTMSELSQDLLVVRQQEQSLIEEPTSEGGDINIGTAVFVGSTADLGELVKLKRAQRHANTITVQAESVTDVQAEARLPEILPEEPTA
jgi:ABC-type transport system involved in cytochrome bd biosynthesis fused ATPase/permease subunit